jgi:DNA-binding transcriptional regulator YdaS (Cro superfamily)
MNALDKAIKVAGGVTALASRLGTYQSKVSNWKSRKGVPAKWCIAIEQATGGKVTRNDLRPDVFGASTHSKQSKHKTS